MPSPVLILPGIGSSGPQHWQTLWEREHPAYVRVEQRDWDNPVCDEWVAALERAAQAAGPQCVLVAHSLACLVVAHWAARPHAPVAAALLVAVPDPSGPSFPGHAVGFSSTPAAPLGFRSTLVISDDDPYGSPEHAEALALAWGSAVARIGARGHINASSGLGAWPEGLALLAELRGAP
jgi:uncharacterized protein